MTRLPYERLQSLIAEYRNESTWLIIFPGDWHFLKNFQEVLTKVYFDSGLSQLASASGYLPKSVSTNFKRTQRFLFEVWESFHWVLMAFYWSEQAPSNFLEHVSKLIKNFSSLKELLSEISDNTAGELILVHSFRDRLRKIQPSNFDISSFVRTAWPILGRVSLRKVWKGGAKAKFLYVRRAMDSVDKCPAGGLVALPQEIF